MGAVSKAIFITGGGSGIGRAVALRFAREGWFVGLADINAESLAATQAMLPEARSTTHVMDVCDHGAWVVALTAFTQASGGRLDVLFNNAGIAFGGPLHLVSPEQIDQIVRVDLAGVIKGAHAAYPFLKATPGSMLLNTASASGIYGPPALSAYAAVKAGVRAFSESLDAEWSADGIRVSVLMPSFIDTPLLDAPALGNDRPARETLSESGLEFTPLEEVAQAVWDGVHGNRLHLIVGRTARRLAFAARWFPGALRRQFHRQQQAGR